MCRSKKKKNVETSFTRVEGKRNVDDCKFFQLLDILRIEYSIGVTFVDIKAEIHVFDYTSV